MLKDVKAYHFNEGIFMNEYRNEEVTSIIKNYFTVKKVFKKGLMWNHGT